MHTISDLVKLTGISAHTLRAWEKRYSIISPQRLDNGERRYNDQHVQLLKSVSILKQEGLRISKIADMEHETILKKALELSGRRHGDHRSMLQKVMDNWDPFVFEKWIDQRFNLSGVIACMLEEVFPLMHKLHFMSLTGEVDAANRDYIYNTITRKLLYYVEHARQRNNSHAHQALLVIPGGGQWDHQLVYYQYVLEKMGYYTSNLGGVDDLDRLKQWCKQHKTDVALVVLTTQFTSGSAQGFVNDLSTALSGAPILATGYQSKMIKASEKIIPIKHIADTIDYIQESWAIHR